MVSIVPNLFSGIWSYLAAACVGALIAGSGAGYVVHRIDQGAIAALKLADQQAQTQALRQAGAIRRSEDQANLDAALAEAKAQAAIVTRTHTITREIPVHVPEARPCIPYGLVRLLDDAARGGDTAGAPAPAGQPDDSCAPLSWRAFAGELADDYASGRANAEQLNALEADVRALVAAANAPPARHEDGR